MPSNISSNSGENPLKIQQKKLSSIREEELRGKLLRSTRERETIPSSTPLRHSEEAIDESRSIRVQRKNWLEVLRSPNLNLHYVDHGRRVQLRRKKRRHIPTESIIETLVSNNENTRNEITEIFQALSPVSNQTPIGDLRDNITADVQLQREPIQDLTFTSKHVLETRDTNSPRNVNNEIRTEDIKMKQQNEQHIYEDIESISTISDNLLEWKRVIRLFNREICQTSSVGILRATFAFDVNIILEAKVERLQIKLDLLKDIICNVSFNIFKTNLLRSRSLAAVTYNFLKELESADILRIKDNGHFVELT